MHGPWMRATQWELMPRTWRKQGFVESSGVLSPPKDEVAPVSKKNAGPVYFLGDKSSSSSDELIDSGSDAVEQVEEIKALGSAVLLLVEESVVAFGRSGDLC
jgi:hypothetical protein